MIKTKSYTGVISFYSLIQFANYLFIGNHKSIIAFLNLLLIGLFFLYFLRKETSSENIIIPAILLIIFLASGWSLLGMYSMIAWVASSFSATFSYFSCLLREKQISTLFLTITFCVNAFTTHIYLVLHLLYQHKTIFCILSTSILFLLPLPLTIHAHINQRNIEKYFHLLYMVFAPILLDLFMIPLKEASFLILCIPPLFVLRNCYLWYRDYKRKQAIREDKD